MTTTSRVFYGWWVTVAFSVMVFLSMGIRFTVGPFLKPMVADLGIDRATFSVVISLSLLLYGVFGPWVGRIADRLGTRTVAVTGTVILSACVAATGLVTTVTEFALVYGVGVAFGLAMTGPVVASAVVARWFRRRRAVALSMLGAASMAGMSLLVPVAMWLILTIGWRLTYPVLGLAALVVIVPIAIGLMRDSPESVGLTPDGDDAPSIALAAPRREAVPVGWAMGTRPFGQLAGALSTCGFSMSLVAAHGVPMLTDHGYHPMVASSAFAVLAGSNVLFAILLGAIADRYGSRLVLVGIYGGRVVAFALLFLIRDHPATLFAVAALGGATMAGTFAMTSTLIADIFGPYSVGVIFGAMFLVHQAGAALGSWLGGAMFEATGGYGAAFAVACTILGIAAFVTLAVDTKPRTLTVPEQLAPIGGGR